LTIVKRTSSELGKRRKEKMMMKMMVGREIEKKNNDEGQVTISLRSSPQ
jgi:hypothetical protein